jgi:hypothetical protein
MLTSLIFKRTSRDVVPEFTGHFVISRSRVLVALSKRFSGGDGKFSSEAVAHL